MEPGDPNTVHKDGAAWFSAVRPCLVLKCVSGTIETVVDGCGSSPSAPPPPTAATTTAAVHWKSHYYPCTSSETGDVYQHGETWLSETIHCAVYRCMNGTELLTGFNCGADLPDPEPYDPDAGLSDPEPVDPGTSGTGSPSVLFPTLAPTSAPATAAALSPTLPALAPRPGPDGTAGEPGSSCVDDYGQSQASGNSWSVPSRPCVRYRCQDGVIHSATTSCPPPPPGCSPLQVAPGQCCPSFTCPQGPLGCTYRGRTYSSGDVFSDNALHPCQENRCDDGIVVSLRPPTVCTAIYCARPIWPEGACCKTCPGRRNRRTGMVEPPTDKSAERIKSRMAMGTRSLQNIVLQCSCSLMVGRYMLVKFQTFEKLTLSI